MIRCHKVWSGIAHRATAAHHAHRAPPHHVGIRHAHHVARHTVAITVCKYVAGAVVAGGALAGGAAIGGLPGLSGAPAAYVPIDSLNHAVEMIAARYPRPVRALALEDEWMLHDLRCEHSGLIALESGANAAIREMAR